MADYWQSSECAQILEWKIPIPCLFWEEHCMHHLYTSSASVMVSRESMLLLIKMRWNLAARMVNSTVGSHAVSSVSINWRMDF